MRKQDFVKAISEKNSVTEKEAEKALKMVLDTITDTLEKGEEINITGFGKFRVAETSERKTINPQTKQEMTVPAGKAVRFTAGSTLKSVVNGKTDK